MSTSLKAIAQNCLRGAEDNTQTFPQIVETLINAGFEGYTIDFRRAVGTYYLPSGDSIELPLDQHLPDVAATFDTSTIQAAIREAQQQVPDYTYTGFCKKVTQAGCAGYMVSFLGRRVVYFGRTAETHIELFPNAHS